MKEFDTFALALIYPNLPEELKEKVMFSILSKAGLSISLGDLKSKTRSTTKFEDFSSDSVASPASITMPVYRPSIYCPSCRKKLHEIGKNEPNTPELEAEYLDKHLDDCPIFQVFEKHRKP